MSLLIIVRYSRTGRLVSLLTIIIIYSHLPRRLVSLLIIIIIYSRAKEACESISLLYTTTGQGGL